MKFALLPLSLAIMSNVALAATSSAPTGDLTQITPTVKPASAYTISKNDAVANYLDFANTDDFIDATRGFIAIYPSYLKVQVSE